VNFSGWIFWLPNCGDLLPKYLMNLRLLTKAISKLLVTQHVVEPWSNLDDLQGLAMAYPCGSWWTWSQIGSENPGVTSWEIRNLVETLRNGIYLHINWCKPTGFLKHQLQSHKPVLLRSSVRTFFGRASPKVEPTRKKRSLMYPWFITWLVAM